MWMQILLADNQPKVRLGLRVLLERQPGFKVVGEAVNAEELLARMEADRPDLVLLGWELPGLARVDPLASRCGEPVACTEPSRSEPSGHSFFKIVRAGFAQRRKQLRNALAAELALPAGEVAQALSKAGVNPKRRAQTLSIEEWARVWREIL